MIVTIKSFGQPFYIGGNIGIGLNGSTIMAPSNTSYTGAASSKSVFGGYTLNNKIISFEVAYSHIYSNYTGGGDVTYGAYSINRNRIIPTIKFMGKTSGSFYLKLGLVLDLQGVVQKEMLNMDFDNYLHYGAPSSTYRADGFITAFTQGNVTPGYNWALGINFRFIENASFFMEINNSAYHWSPTHTEVIDGGGSDLSKYTIAQKQQNHVANPVASSDPNQPTEVPLQSYHFSNVGFNFGFIIHFGKKKDE